MRRDVWNFSLFYEESISHPNQQTANIKCGIISDYTVHK